METVFQTAVTNRDETYLDAEARLRSGGAPAAEVLDRNRDHPDPIARLIAHTQLKWMQGRAPDYQAALEYLEWIPKRLAKTPVGTPPPQAVANDLSERFGAGAADFLALRLVKQTDWPRWKRLGVLFHLQQQRSPATTAALIRLAAESGDAEMRRYVSEALKGMEDPDLEAKLAYERERLEAHDRTLPEELKELSR